jgi:RNA polymerase sigma-54 factor
MVEQEEEEEEEETPEQTEPVEEEKPSATDEIDWEEILLNGFDAGGGREEHEEKEYYEPVTVASRDLSDYLWDQVKLLNLNDRQLLLAEEFIGNINDEGYLTAPMPPGVEVNHETVLKVIVDGINEVIRKAAEEVEREADNALFTMEDAEEMLRTIQALDPPGVAARDLRECLMLQLREAGLEQSVPYRLIRDCFDELINHRWSEISKRFGISPSDVQKAADEIAKLDPKPGLVYSSAGDNYIIPDLVVEKIDGLYHVFLNDANLPRLKLSRAYQEIARDKKKFEGENKEFISSKLNSANWMIQAIEQRRQTMLKVMNFIVDRQREFFEKGVQFLKPLTLREVAEVINMHESTVSRVTNEKYVQTPRGVLPLKFFFSSGLSSTCGDDVSALVINAQI